MRLIPFLLALLLIPSNLAAPNGPVAPADVAPAMINPGFECGEGFHDQPGIPGMVPNGWTAEILARPAKILSTQLWAKIGGCEPNDMGWEKLEGYDSLILLPGDVLYGQDFDSPPFDIAWWQTVKVAPGADYSVSAWMTSLCGGSSMPNDCPPGSYMSKMAALDPIGGTDPESPALAWIEDRRPHQEARWANLVVATTAKNDRMTVFLRLKSPSHHHGNHAFADAVKLVRSPAARFGSVGAKGREITVTWNGDLGPDIPTIPASTHLLSFEVQAQRNSGGWQAWQKGIGAGGATLAAPGSCRDEDYRFRVRAWAIQPAGQAGSWPFHEFVGVWQESGTVRMPKTADCAHRTYLPHNSR